jgi:hypothetical protein
MGRNPEKPILDMTPDGQFRSPPKIPIGARVAALAVIVAVIAGGLAIAALAIWLVFLMIPIVLIALLIAYLAFRFQTRKGSFRSANKVFHVDIFRR